MRARLAFPIAALIAGSLAACGTSGSSSSPSYKGEQGKVANVVSNLTSYGQSKETAKICNKLLAADLAKKLAASGESCETVIGDQLTNVDDFTTTVKSVTVSGNSAQAVVQSKRNGKDSLATLNFAKAPDGTWRIESLQ